VAYLKDALQQSFQGKRQTEAEPTTPSLWKGRRGAHARRLAARWGSGEACAAKDSVLRPAALSEALTCWTLRKT
jgi:hypothetical protein